VGEDTISTACGTFSDISRDTFATSGEDIPSKIKIDGKINLLKLENSAVFSEPIQ